jgi:flagellar basal-body rod protein FlgC
MKCMEKEFKGMNLLAMMDQSGQAMQAERMRAEVVAANMANAETTRTSAGVPYHRQHIVFTAGKADGSFASQLNRSMPVAGDPDFNEAALASVAGNPPGSEAAAPGVSIAAVVQDTAPPLKRYDPGHPDADSEGYVSYPDINPLTEMVDLMGATRAYGLNASAVQAEKSMISSSLDLGK